MTEKLYFLSDEGALFRVHIDPFIAHYFHNCFEVFDIIGKVLAEDYDVIYVYETDDTILMLEGLVHESLKGSRGVA